MTGMMSAHETFQQAMIQEIKDEVKINLKHLLNSESCITAWDYNDKTM